MAMGYLCLHLIQSPVLFLLCPALPCPALPSALESDLLPHGENLDVFRFRFRWPSLVWLRTFDVIHLFSSHLVVNK